MSTPSRSRHDIVIVGGRVAGKATAMCSLVSGTTWWS
jgi:hypothetical protein